MNPVFAARRRAEEFQSLVEGDASAEAVDGRYADLLGVVATLRSEPLVQPRAAFVDDLRARLMTAAATALVPDTETQSAARRTPPARRSGRERRIAVAVGGFAIVTASASMSVAAQTALPGDPLYPLKRAIESAHAGVQTDPESKGATMLDSASGRLAEVDALTRDSSSDDEQIAATLHDFAQQASAASALLLTDYDDRGDEGSIQELRSFTTTSMESLTDLQRLVPPDARASLIEAATILQAIDRQALTVCPLCSDEPVTLAPAAARQSIDELLGLVEQELRAPSSTTGPTGSATPDGTAGGRPDATPDTDPPAPGVGVDPVSPEVTPPPVVDPRPDNPIQGLTDGLRGLGDGATNAAGGSLKGLLGGLGDTLGGLGSKNP